MPGRAGCRRARRLVVTVQNIDARSTVATLRRAAPHGYRPVDARAPRAQKEEGGRAAAERTSTRPWCHISGTRERAVQSAVDDQPLTSCPLLPSRLSSYLISFAHDASQYFHLFKIQVDILDPRTTSDRRNDDFKRLRHPEPSAHAKARRTDPQLENSDLSVRATDSSLTAREAHGDARPGPARREEFSTFLAELRSAKTTNIFSRVSAILGGGHF